MANQEKTFGESEFIVSKTDLKGKITYGNELFIKMSGYAEEELLGAPHNILRHPAMPSIVFKLLWDRVQKGEEIFAYVKNQSKNSDFYWVLAHVTSSFDEKGAIIGYHSVRRKPKAETVKKVEALYGTLLSKEKSGGVKASAEALGELLKSQKVSYDEFILTL
jgi:PAS domain S-box-containing protein